MSWVQQSLIFKPQGNFSWSKTHAQVPTAFLMKDRIRIYYATRDDQGRSYTSFIDVSKDNPADILYVHNKPILPLGKPGTHDEDGVMVACVIQQQDAIWLYYTGWSRGHTVPYHISIGLAKSYDGGVSFERVFEGPIIGRTPLEPYMTMSPYVLFQDDKWRMWYGSGFGWVEIDGRMESLYAIKYAESSDGLHWIHNNTLCIPPLHPLEANTRPSVCQTRSGYEMWFCYRHSFNFREGGVGAYQMGYATSQDGIHWERQSDFRDLRQSLQSWNNEMLAYPNVLEVNNRRIMFFNGNGFGKAGFGYAVWNDLLP